MDVVLQESRPDPARVLTKAVLRAADLLGVRGRRLAAVLGVSEAKLSRCRSGQAAISPESKEGELALLFIRLHRSLDALVGGDDRKAAAWLSAPNAHLAGVPAERIEKVEGLVDVLQYLDAMRGAS